MAYKIAIASGKGGTGKTTVAINLFSLIQKKITNNVILVDCDVEEPNDSLFFPEANIINSTSVTQQIPEINKDKCTYCRKCVDYCVFNAIVVIPGINFAEANSSLCHSCGACSVACEYDAITEKPFPVGEVAKFDNQLVEGKLKIGSTMQTYLIKKLKERVSNNADVILYDAPPGTSCPVVETVADTDYVILVTEPTPFGLYDLKLTVAMLKELEKPFGVIINKSGIGNLKLYNYLECENIEILGDIPYNKKYASNYALGSLLTDIPEDILLQYEYIVEKLERELFINEGVNYIKR